jgi:hypothetical protein
MNPFMKPKNSLFKQQNHISASLLSINWPHLSICLLSFSLRKQSKQQGLNCTLENFLWSNFLEQNWHLTQVGCHKAPQARTPSFFRNFLHPLHLCPSDDAQVLHIKTP